MFFKYFFLRTQENSAYQPVLACDPLLLTIFMGSTVRYCCETTTKRNYMIKIYYITTK